MLSTINLSMFHVILEKKGNVRYHANMTNLLVDLMKNNLKISRLILLKLWDTPTWRNLQLK